MPHPMNSTEGELLDALLECYGPTWWYKRRVWKLADDLHRLREVLAAHVTPAAGDAPEGTARAGDDGLGDEPEYTGTCPFAIYGPPAACTCRSCDLVEYWRSRAGVAEALARSRPDDTGVPTATAGDVRPAAAREPQKFRKKPVVVEAVQWHGLYGPLWALGLKAVITEPGNPGIEIDTLEGRMRVHRGDWIIRGVAGEFYPCRPDIFAATYVLAEPRAVEGTSPPVDATPPEVVKAQRPEGADRRDDGDAPPRDGAA